MNLVTGEIIELYEDAGEPMAKVSVGAAFARVRIALVEGARVGDHVLIESGVAIARVLTDQHKEG